MPPNLYEVSSDIVLKTLAGKLYPPATKCAHGLVPSLSCLPTGTPGVGLLGNKTPVSCVGACAEDASSARGFVS